MKKEINLITSLTIFFCFLVKSSCIFTTIQNLLEEKFQNLEHKNHKAYVTNFNLEDTNLIIQNRRKFTREQMIKQFSLSNEEIKIPKISVCFSGGGYRAMLTTLGVLKALEEIQVLSMVENIYSLSGSTWLINIWLASNLNLNKLDNYLKGKLANNMKFNIDKIKRLASVPLNKNQYKELLKCIAIFWQQKIGHSQRINIIDIWGLLIALNIYPEDLDICQECLSNQAMKLKSGNWPISISTAITPINETDNINKITDLTPKNDYKWLLFNAVQVSLEHQNILYSIPTWAFGREFKNGKSVDDYKGQAPELPLAYLLGIFGSAFSGSPQEYLKIMDNMMLFKDLPLVTKTIKLATQIGFKDKRVAPAKVCNFLEHLDNTQKKQITVIDAGLECNIPLYPILKYDTTEIILIFDASTESRSVENLKKIVSKALPNGKIKIIEQENHLLLQVDSKLIFYLPLDKFANIIYPKECNLFTKDELINGFGQITNFTYEEKQFNALTKLVNTNVINHGSKIRKLISDYINL